MSDGGGGEEGGGTSGSGRPRESSVPRRARARARGCVCGQAAQGGRVVGMPRQRRAGPRQADRGPASARVKSVQFHSFSSSVSFITQEACGASPSRPRARGSSRMFGPRASCLTGGSNVRPAGQMFDRRVKCLTGMFDRRVNDRRFKCLTGVGCVRNV